MRRSFWNLFEILTKPFDKPIVRIAIDILKLLLRENSLTYKRLSREAER